MLVIADACKKGTRFSILHKEWETWEAFMCVPVNYLNALDLTHLHSHLILTKCFEELRRGKLSIEENGAVVDVESSAHTYQQNFQAAWKGSHR